MCPLGRLRCSILFMVWQGAGLCSAYGALFIGTWKARARRPILCAKPRELVRAAGYNEVGVVTRLGPGDLLLTKPSQKYENWPFKLAWRLWPSPLIRMLGNKFRLYLLLRGRKPA